MSECSIEGCLRGVYARSLCHPHYKRWWRATPPEHHPRPQKRPLLTRLMEKVEPRQRITVPLADPWCWEWAGTLTGKGYGSMNTGRQGGSKGPHVVAYELFVGPVPAGLDLDHLCKNIVCCNPAHAEAVPRSENLRRSRRLKTHCKRGHPFVAENIYINPTSGARVCRTCARERRS